jgi:hypothetical protein
MNEYRVSYNEEYVLSSVERYRRQRHVYPWFIAVKVVCALGLAMLIAIIIYGALASPGKSGPPVLIAFVLAIFLLLLIQGPRIDYFFLKRRLRKSPFYGDELTPRSQTTLRWSAFTRARRFPSGFLLFTGPTVFHWWPDSARTQGTAEDVTCILRQNVAAYESNDASIERTSLSWLRQPKAAAHVER